MYYIRKFMKEKNITQRQLAKFSGLTEASISRYISGEREPKIDNYNKMAAMFGYRLELVNMKTWEPHVLEQREAIEKRIERE